MRSRTSGMESSDSGDLQVREPGKSFQKDMEEGDIQEQMRKTHTAEMNREIEEENSGPVKKTQRPGGKCQRKATLMELSKEELLGLLTIMEGELQAREDIIHMLMSERTQPEILEAHYGSAVPIKPLQALQRDSQLTHGGTSRDDVYELPMMELDRLEEKQRETYRRMLEQLLLAERCHRRTVTELDSEKRKHADYMNKSDDFTCLLEQERERLKRLLEQEKAYQVRKEKENSRRLEKVREELVKLKSFALMLVEERQLHVGQIDQQSQKIQDLSKTLQEREQHFESVTSKSKEDSQKIQKLEEALEHGAATFAQEHEEMTTKLSNQESQSRQLRLKLVGLSHRIEELEENNRVLQKSEENLQELRDKISRGECGNSSFMAELENLRKKVLEMEGKDEEITKTEAQCKELRRKLQDEESHSRELKLEIEKLQKRMADLEKLETAFNVSKSECRQLHANLEREKNLTKNLSQELEGVKKHIKELECSESRLEKAEVNLKDDLTKLKSFTVILMDERKNMAERMKQEERKSEDMSKMLTAEQSKVMEVTEKLIEESKKLLKLKSEMENKVSSLTKEKTDLRARLAREEEKQKDLCAKVILMQKRIDCLEETERQTFQSQVELDKMRHPDEDNKVKELTVEIERLKNRLMQLEVVEGDLIKTEDEYDTLEKKFRTEQDKANVLSQLLEDMKVQIARNKAIEKGEAVNQEAELRLKCKMEEAKTRDLQADVSALKEKIHELMNKEDQLSQLHVDYTVLQQRLVDEEDKKKSMSQQILNLTKDLEVTKRYSRALRPSMNGRRIVDVPLTSTAVQTEAESIEAVEDDTPAVFIRKSVLEENHVMSNLRQKGLKKPAVLDRYPPAATELGVRKSWIPWMKKNDTITDGQADSDKIYNTDGAATPQPSELTMSQKPGRPLHIRVTPDHQHSTATVEITSPRAEDFFSSATIIPTLGLQKPRITIVPKPFTVTTKGINARTSCGPERTKSPVTITTISRAKSPDGNMSTYSDGPVSPVSVITVSTSPVTATRVSPEPQETTTGRAVFKVTPEKQTVPTPIRKYNPAANIITTEDNKIHIHLGPQYKRPQDAGGGPNVAVRPIGVSAESKETPPTGTVLRSPRQTSTPAGRSISGKMTSSITITPVTSAPSRPTQSVLLLKCFKMISGSVCSLDSSLSSPGRMCSHLGPQPRESLCQKKMLCST
ncbi:filamin-A-interacting protein 1 isoform X2 [Brachyhypopomus gauderio]|uniref:filamin-A-interacting protein 1 isoform X2 n=1 Tax=Brachyhypopomus gauderio TaxID=698409 RepID=UPI004042BE78